MPYNAAYGGSSIGFETEQLCMNELYCTCSCPRVEVSGVKHKSVWVKAKITQGLRETKRKREREKKSKKRN